MITIGIASDMAVSVDLSDISGHLQLRPFLLFLEYALSITLQDNLWLSQV
ncbi:hypothetical protein MEA186_35884 [Mesorhizobium amorphae CCNWGS0123]|uniref:Uncharacterized protein n=1 Tax=Mesorhizobium amorphae CCNWGS0123 TaxID=1082933 RepID=G6YMC6_9HYPH|nr:hypothetical protein MEA186_35884 [Mesorhizobium amorphae CCNWGS0123]